MSETKTQEQEDLEAADAVARAAKSKAAPDVIVAGKEVAEALWMRFAGKWGWKPLLTAVIATGISIGMIISTRQTPEEVKAVVKEAVKEVKEDPKPSPPQADLAKTMVDGFTKLDKSLSAGFAALGKKLDEKPAPLPVDPDKPKPGPKKLVLPERVEVTVGSIAKISAASASAAHWAWRGDPELDIDRNGNTVYVSAARDGVYWVFAYTSVGGSIPDIAACMVVVLPKPQPIPPAPDPKPPEPKPTPKVDALTIVLVWDTSDLNEWTKGVVGDYAFFKSLEPLGVKWFKVGKQQKDADGQLLLDSHNYRKYVDAQGLPTVIYFDKTGLVLKAARLTDTASIRATVTELMGK